MGLAWPRVLRLEREPEAEPTAGENWQGKENLFFKLPVGSAFKTSVATEKPMRNTVIWQKGHLVF